MEPMPSVLCQSLKSSLAEIVALSRESLRRLINGSSRLAAAAAAAVVAMLFVD